MITRGGRNIFSGLAVRLPLKLGIAGAAVASLGWGRFQLADPVAPFVRRKGVLRLRPFISPLFLHRKIFKRGLPENDIPVRYAGNDGG